MYDGQKLRALRRKRGLTMRGLADLTKRTFPPNGVSFSAIRDFEGGTRSGIHIVPKLAVVLDVPIKRFRL